MKRKIVKTFINALLMIMLSVLMNNSLFSSKLTTGLDTDVKYDSNYLGIVSDPNVRETQSVEESEYIWSTAGSIKYVYSKWEEFSVQGYLSPGVMHTFNNEELANWFVFGDIRAKLNFIEPLFIIPNVSADYTSSYDGVPEVDKTSTDYITKLTEEMNKSFLDNNMWKYGGGIEARYFFSDTVQLGGSYSYNYQDYHRHRIRENPDGTIEGVEEEDVTLDGHLHSLSTTLYYNTALGGMNSNNNLSFSYSYNDTNSLFDSYVLYGITLSLGLDLTEELSLSLAPNVNYFNFYDRGGVETLIFNAGPTVSYKISDDFSATLGVAYKWVDREFWEKDERSLNILTFYKMEKEEFDAFTINVAVSFTFDVFEDDELMPKVLIGEDDGLKRTGGDRSASNSGGGACVGGVCHF